MPGPAPKGPDGELTYMQSRFVEEMIIDNSSQKDAAIRAGYAQKNAASQAYQLMQRPHVRSKIEEINNDVASDLGLTKQRIIRELMSIAFLNPKHLIRQDEFGNTTIDLRHVPDEVAAALTGLSITETKTGGKDVKFSLSDKQNALITLAKMLGWYKEKVDVSTTISLEHLINQSFKDDPIEVESIPTE